VRVVNRGHPAPLLLAADGAVVAWTPAQEAPPLGMSALGVWESPVESFSLPAGATLLCYTDGLTEARDRHGRFYDPMARLPDLLPQRPVDPHRPDIAERLLHLLAADVRRHCGGRPQDDQALLAVHRVAT
jgi:serine phosphatase RsbU (regulator of sigma subunit)